MSGSASFAYIEDRLDDSLLYKLHRGGTEDVATVELQARELIYETRALRRQIAASAWRPIESAPKQGQRVLMFMAYAPERGIVHGYYDRGLWNAWHGSVGGVTHWMPEPEPPKGDA